MNDKLLKTILKDIESYANENLADKYKIYHKKTGHKELGILTPVLRGLMKKYRKEIMLLSFKERKELSLKLYKLKISDYTLFANDILAQSINDFTAKDFGYLDNVLNYFTGWGQIDDFCINVIQPLLKKYPKETLQILERWNKSDNLWERRASVVAFVRKIGESGKYTNECISLCDNLKYDEEGLVLKGIGWALKDSMRGDKDKIIKYIKKLKSEKVSSFIILYAIRDLKEKDRQSILK